MPLVFSKKKFKKFCEETSILSYEKNEGWANILDGRKVTKRKGIYRCYDKNHIKYYVDKDWCVKK